MEHAAGEAGRRPGKHLHRRSIEVNTYEYDTSAVLIEGRLTDNRFCTTHFFSGEARPPGIIHDMIIRFVLRGPESIIESIEVEMPGVPRMECLETKQSLAGLEGMHIRSGFTEQVKRMIGGAKGCSHLMALLLAMSSAALQGAWVALARRPVKLSVFGDRALELMENTCWVWRTDGGALKVLRERIETAE